MHIYSKASLTEYGTIHPIGTVGTYLKVVVLPIWLDDDY